MFLLDEGSECVRKSVCVVLYVAVGGGSGSGSHSGSDDSSRGGCLESDSFRLSSE